jgi:hypothetical protein
VIERGYVPLSARQPALPAGARGIISHMTEPVVIAIGHQETDRITLEVLRRERPDGDFWDGNWLVVDMHLRVGGFVGHAVADLRTEEFETFRRELEAMYRNVDGTAKFESLEHWLTVNVTCEKTGRVTVQGDATDRVGMGNRLKFWLPDMDQTFLPALIDQLIACEKAYPVVGTRPSG